jgi:triacylglycerol esterase/lipase EstA (alpha/beta hydrolase family)
VVVRQTAVTCKHKTMKKISLFKKVSIVIIILIIILYQIPAKQANFFESYKKNNYASKILKEFYKKEVKFITVNNVKWKYLTSGNSDKTILFLHGMGGAYDLWWQQIDFFDKDYKVITYTLPEKIDNLEDVLTGIKAILEKENVDKFIAVGTSMGGYISQYVLKKMPERVEKVVFSNTFPPNGDLLKENKTKSKVIPLFT